MAASFRPAVLKAIDDWKAAIADKELCPHEHLRLAADACSVLESILSGVGEDDEQFMQLVGDVEWAVETYVVPLDLSQYKVPAFLERFVIDPQLVPSVRPLLEALRPAKHDHPA